MTNTDTPAVAPCPLCASPAALGLTNSADERSGYVRTFTAYCTACNCMVARTSKTGQGGRANESDESVKERVRSAWNCRATPAPDVRDEIAAILNRAMQDGQGDQDVIALATDDLVALLGGGG
jgi:hypothetical protein